MSDFRRLIAPREDNDVGRLRFEREAVEEDEGFLPRLVDRERLES